MRAGRRIAIRVAVVGFGLAGLALTVPTFAATKEKPAAVKEKPAAAKPAAKEKKAAPVKQSKAAPAKQSKVKCCLVEPDQRETTPPAPPTTEGPAAEETTAAPPAVEAPATPETPAYRAAARPPMDPTADTSALSTTLFTASIVFASSAMLLLGVLWRLRRGRGPALAADEAPTLTLPPGVGAELAKLTKDGDAAGQTRPAAP